MAMLAPRHLKLLMRPLVRLFLRHNYSLHDFIGLAKSVFVEVAQDELASSGVKPNVSSISAVTGLYRKEVAQIFKRGAEPIHQGVSLLARVIGRWENDRKFRDKTGAPRGLTFGFAGSEFATLVAFVSTDTHDGTILKELTRAGLAQVVEEKVVLKKREALVPGDIDRAINVIAMTTGNCLDSGEQNAVNAPEPRNLHVHTSYDNVYVDKLPEIRAWVLEQGRDFHRRLRQFIAPFDADLGIDQDLQRPAGARVSISSCSAFAERIKPEQS